MPNLDYHLLATLVFFVGTLVFVFLSIGIGRLVRPRVPTSDKNRIYECGEPTIGSAWVRYNIAFYMVALVFLVFDVETVFLFPVAKVYRWFVANGFGSVALLEIIGFVAILVIGLVYAWRFGNLDWAAPVSGGQPSQRSFKQGAGNDVIRSLEN